MHIFRSIKNRTMEMGKSICSLPKNIYFNFKVLPLRQAIKLPIYVDYGVKIQEVYKNVIEIDDDNVYRYMISFGRGGSDGIAKTSKGIISFKDTTRIVFEGPAQFHSGVRLWADENAVLRFGKNFSANKNFTLFYNDEIFFGQDCMVGWNVEIIDGNGHSVINDNIKKSNTCKITIGNHVWIGANVKICRSVKIGDNSIVAYGSTVVGGCFGSYVMLGGYPAKVIKNNVNWEK